MKILLIGDKGLISTPITRYLLERDNTIPHHNHGKFHPYSTTSSKPVPGGRADGRYAVLWVDHVCRMVAWRRGGDVNAAELGHNG